MPKPTNKSELVQAANTNFHKLVDQVNGMPLKDQENSFPEGSLNRNVRDVLAHLHHWHLMLFEWYQIGMAGEKPEMPAKGYTWKMTKELNQVINAKYMTIPLAEVKEMLNASFTKIMDLIEKHSEEELFEKKRYAWTGSTSLGAYLISNTSSHYDWGFKIIKKSLK
ncbi:MAG: ClbS/DfsB family four-helix bundle protein [Flavobacteriales bacterium]|nr:ClbS/DfsB family four-helix bundle protein [Flavobacteriales bacterium]